MAQANKTEAPKRKRPWKWRVGLVVLALVLTGGLYFLLRPQPIDVEMARVSRGVLRVVVDEDGHTRVRDRHIVSAPLAGSLARIEARPGDAVQEDTIVAELLPLPEPLLNQSARAQAESRLAAAQASFRQTATSTGSAEADLSFAQSELARYRLLADKGTITRQRLERAELQERIARETLASSEFGARVAKHGVELAKAALGHLGRKNEGGETMSLKSPVNGVVLDVMQTSEGVVNSGTPLLEIGDPATLEVVVDVLSADAVRIEKGARATIVRWGGDEDLLAHVHRVEPKAYSKMSSLGVEERRVDVVLEMDSDKALWSRLGDGFRVEAQIVIWQGDDVITVPTSAIFKEDERWSVYVVKQGKAEIRPVILGHRGEFAAEISEGLAVDEEVILHPGEKIKAGTRVRAL